MTNRTNQLLESLFVDGPWTWEYNGKEIVILDSKRMLVARVGAREDASEQVAHACLLVKSRELLRWLNSIHMGEYRSSQFMRTEIGKLLTEIRGAVDVDTEHDNSG